MYYLFLSANICAICGITFLLPISANICAICGIIFYLLKHISIFAIKPNLVKHKTIYEKLNYNNSGDIYFH
ncbi:MAG: hypothetical protein WAT52_06250, partial [Chitinophagales bacterium]